MAERTVPLVRTCAPARVRHVPVGLVALLLAVVALLPRCLDLSAFTTIDEAYHWQGRVERFAEALRAQHWSATSQSGHPGVTTMWLGSAGRWLAALLGVGDPGWAGGGLGYLAMLRLPLAVFNSAAVVLGWLLLRRLLPPRVALLAAVLWATSPFIIAHSRMLHLDALLTSCMTLSLLCLLCSLAGAERTARTEWGWLAASGACAGLALLTKGPALILLPPAGLLLFAWRWAGMRAANPGMRLPTLFGAALRGAVLRYAVWLGVAALLVVVLWPAMWVEPRYAISTVIKEVLQNGGEPEPAGNYFLGQAVADPGPLFYPLVLLLRATPLSLIGLVAWLAQAAWHVAARRRERTSGAAHADGVLWSLLFFALFFGVALSIGPKKFDRYLLPIWPVLEIVAAAGLIAIAGRACRMAARWRGAGLLAWALSGATTLIIAAQLLLFFPYYMSYYNPLLGGGATAQYVMLVGLGEGMEQVGAWISARPDLRSGEVLSWIYPTLAPFVPKDVPVKDLRVQYFGERANYAVLYVRSVQRKESAAAEAYVRQTAPLYTVRMHGITYAEVHQLPRPFAQPVEAVFGAGVHLRGFSTARLGSTLVITPSWDMEADQPGGRFAFVRLLDEQGRKISQLDAPLDQGMFAQWQAGQQFDAPFPLALPADLPPGRYRLVLGVYDPGSGARLPVRGGMPLPPDVDGPEVLLLDTVQLR